MVNTNLDPIGTLDDVRKRVVEYEARVQAGDVEHHSISRDRAFLLTQIDLLQAEPMKDAAKAPAPDVSAT